MDQEVESNPVPEAQPEQPSISLQDLVLVLNLIRMVAERGAIKVDEMSAVGAVYQKLFSFLKASGAISEESKEAN
jgi:hypothetical protein